MGVFIAVKKTAEPVPPGCQQHDNIAAAIASPFDTIGTFTDTADNRVDASKFGAVQYTDNGGNGDSSVPVSVYNISNPSATCVIYIVDSGGSTIDTYNNSGGGSVEGQYMLLPAGTPFYVVIENTGSGNCDIYEIQLSDPV